MYRENSNKDIVLSNNKFFLAKDASKMTMNESSNLAILNSSQEELEKIFDKIKKQTSKTYDKFIPWETVQPIKNDGNAIIYIFSCIIYILSFGKIDPYIDYRYHKRDALIIKNLKKLGFKVKAKFFWTKERKHKISW